MRDSNPRHPACKAGALAAELIALAFRSPTVSGEAADSVGVGVYRKGEVQGSTDACSSVW